MKNWAKTLVLFLLLFSCQCSPSSGVLAQVSTLALDFSPPQQPNHINVNIQIQEKFRQRIRNARGKKLSIPEATIWVNDREYETEDLHLRGNTTLNFERKSFTVELADELTMEGKEGPVKLDAFYLVSLTMDRFYYCNRLSYDLLKALGLFPLYYDYAEVKINGQTQGIYLFVQRPQDWALKTHHAPFMVRRGLDGVIDKERIDKKVDKKEIQAYRNQFKSIYNLIHLKEGQQLYAELSKIVNLEQYFSCLGFNLLIQNGDYTDEFYFYIDPETKKFNIMPWDYDDIFAREPHEGLDIRSDRFKPGTMLFSSEDMLDRTIATDSCLYKQYLLQLRQVLQRIDACLLQHTLQEIYRDLYPLYSDETILAALKKDGYHADLELLENSMQQVFNQLTFSRTSFEEMISSDR